MAIKSIVETSMVDWDGKIVMVLFVGGCNFRCPFCQNWEVAFKSGEVEDVPWEEIVKKLDKRREWIDGVVISGGEPLIDMNFVLGLTEKVRKLKLKIKIDTNGEFPEVIEKLTEKTLIDYVALDVKAPLDERYFLAAGKKVDLQKLKASIELLKADTVDYEFRTTAVPSMVNKQTVGQIGIAVQDGKKFVLQQFVPRLAYRPEYQRLKPYTKEEAEVLLAMIKNHVKEAKLRGF